MKTVFMIFVGLAMVFAWASMSYMLLYLGWTMFWTPRWGFPDQVMALVFWFLGLALSIAPFASVCSDPPFSEKQAREAEADLIKLLGEYAD